MPECAAHKNHRHRTGLAGLDERERFGQLVEGAEAARHDDIGGGIFDEGDLARKKMPKAQAEILVSVGVLLLREFDVQADTGGFAGERALVGRFHQAWPTAGNHCKASVGKPPGDVFSEFIPGRIGTQARAAENAHSRTDVGEAFGGLDEL